MRRLVNSKNMTLGTSPVLLFFLTGAFCTTLIAISIHDFRNLRVPDTLSLPLTLAGLMVVLVMPDITFSSRIWGAATGFLSLAVIGEVYFRRYGREGLGLGDAKLFAAAGAWLGTAALPIVLLLASILGLVSAFLMGHGDRDREIPFAPFIAAGMLMVWLYQIEVLGFVFK